MISPFIQNLGKAKGFSQDEQLVLQIALGGILGNQSNGGGHECHGRSRFFKI